MASGIAMWGLPTKAWDFADGIPGCGAIRSTLHDMLIYVRANLSPDSTPLSKAIELAHQPRFTVREATEKNPSKREIGLAWLITTDRGKTIIWHNGMTGGYAAFVAMVPAEQLGIVVLGQSGNERRRQVWQRTAQRLARWQAAIRLRASGRRPKPAVSVEHRRS